MSVAVKRRHRLRGAGAFAAVRRRRAAASAGTLRVQLAPNDAAVARVGFVVPRAVGGAVERNRVRRRLRALLRGRLATLAGLDVVVAAGPGAVSASWAALAADLDGGLAAARARLARGDGAATPPQPDARAGAPRRPLWDNRLGGGDRGGRREPERSRPAAP